MKTGKIPYILMGIFLFYKNIFQKVKILNYLKLKKYFFESGEKIKVKVFIYL